MAENEQKGPFRKSIEDRNLTKEEISNLENLENQQKEKIKVKPEQKQILEDSMNKISKHLENMIKNEGGIVINNLSALEYVLNKLGLKDKKNLEGVEDGEIYRITYGEENGETGYILYKVFDEIKASLNQEEVEKLEDKTLEELEVLKLKKEDLFKNLGFTLEQQKIWLEEFSSDGDDGISLDDIEVDVKAGTITFSFDDSFLNESSNENITIPISSLKQGKFDKEEFLNKLPVAVYKSIIKKQDENQNEAEKQEKEDLKTKIKDKLKKDFIALYREIPEDVYKQFENIISKIDIKDVDLDKANKKLILGLYVPYLADPYENLVIENFDFDNIDKTKIDIKSFMLSNIDFSTKMYNLIGKVYGAKEITVSKYKELINLGDLDKIFKNLTAPQ